MNKGRIRTGKYWDKALSIVEGCRAVSEGCLNCWSATQTHLRANQSNLKIRERYEGLTKENGKFNGKTRLMTDNIEKQLSVKKPTVFSVWNDLFHENVPDGVIDSFWGLVRQHKKHTVLVLTKRPENIYLKRSPDCYGCANLYLGVTVEKQRHAHRIDKLIFSYDGPKFVSIEPMLENIKIEKYLKHITGVICGGEAGKNARDLRMDWVRDLRNQCLRTNTPFFFKQTSGYRPKKLPELDEKVWDQLAWDNN